MKKDIHPTWYQAQVRCMTCETTWTTGATVENLTVEICSNCHPFYTGEQRIVDTEGRVDKFQKRLQRTVEMRSTQDDDAPRKCTTRSANCRFGIECPLCQYPCRK